MPIPPVPARHRAVRHRGASSTDRPTGPPGRIAALGRRSATSVVVSGLVVSMFGSPTFGAAATESSVGLRTSDLAAKNQVAGPSAAAVPDVAGATPWTFDSPTVTLVADPAPSTTDPVPDAADAAAQAAEAEAALTSAEPSVDELAAADLTLAADVSASLAADLSANSGLDATAVGQTGAESLTAVAAAGTRIAAKHPFAVTAPVNTSFGSGAKFESSGSTRTAAFLRGTPVINHTTWTIAVAIAKWTDPLATVRNLKSGVVTSIRIPSTAKSTSDTDKAMTVVQPNGYTAYECYKMTKIGTNSWTTTSMVKQDLRSTGLSVGTRASGVSQMMGLIRADEVALKKIPHTLAVAIPDSMLKSGFVWPARRQDSNASTAYKGQVPMGTMVGIPPSVNVSALGLSGEGLALARALQDYGAHVVERAGMVALYAEPAANATAVGRMKTDWRKLYPLLRVVTNNTPTTVGGGGTRRQPAAAALL